MMRCDRCGKDWPDILLGAHPCTNHLDPFLTPPAARADSLPYEPTEEQETHSPVLHACWRSGMTEGQTIEMLWRAYKQLQVHSMRLAESRPVQTWTIVGLPENKP